MFLLVVLFGHVTAGGTVGNVAVGGTVGNVTAGLLLVMYLLVVLLVM